MSALEMLTEAADLVETQEEQSRRSKESNSPASEERQRLNQARESESREKDKESNHKHTESLRTIQSEKKVPHDPNRSRNIPHSDNLKKVNGHWAKDEISQVEYLRNNATTHHRSSPSERYPSAEENNFRQNQLLQHRVTSPNDHKHLDRRSTSSSSDKTGEKYSSTKPMVLLHPPTASISSNSSAAGPTSDHPTIQSTAMHHPFMYPMMYPARATMDPSLGTINRTTGNPAKEKTQASSVGPSPTDGLPTVSNPMHIPRFMYPFPNQAALMMSARNSAGIADISPFLLSQPTAFHGIHPNLTMLDQYQRLLEGFPQIPPAYHLHPQLTDQYLKTLISQGLDGSKDPITLLANRPPPAVSLATLQGQPAVNEFWLRYPEQLNAARLMRPPDGASPRPMSPYSGKSRSDSPNVINGNKVTGAGYSYADSHDDKTQTRSPHYHRTKSPEVMDQRSRDLSRIGFNPSALSMRDPTVINHTSKRNSDDRHNPHLATSHTPRGYMVPMAAVHRGRERSMSPHVRDREVHRERTPERDIYRRHSSEKQNAPRHTPDPNSNRHDNRATPPTTNRHQHKLTAGNGNVDVQSHLSMPQNPPADERHSNSASPSTNPYLPPIAPYLGQHLIGGLTGATGAAPSLWIPNYAQFLAPTGKGAAQISPESLVALYKSAENPLYQQRIPVGMTGIPLLHQQQLLENSARRSGLSQDYANALKANAFLSPHALLKDAGKSSPKNGLESHHSTAHPHHRNLLQHGPSSIASSNLKKGSSSPIQSTTSSHENSQSPAPNSVGNSALGAAEVHRYQSPLSPANRDRQHRENSPKSTGHYRPKPMLHRNDDSQESKNRKRKLDEEIAVGEEASNFYQRSQKREKFTAAHNAEQPERRNHTSDEADIEEHFRRSLGKDYKVSDTSNKVSITGSVDDHFKKALGGEIWDKLQPQPPMKSDVPAHILPSYSAALSSSHGTHGHMEYSFANEKNKLHDSYSQQRYYIQNKGRASPHSRNVANSPSPGPKPQYSSPSHSAPTVIKQKVKAKAVVLPHTSTLSRDSNIDTNRPPSLGGPRTISGNGDNAPPNHTKTASSPMTSSSSSNSSAGHQVPIKFLSYGHVDGASAQSLASNVYVNKSSNRPSSASEGHHRTISTGSDQTNESAVVKKQLSGHSEDNGNITT